MKTLQRISLVFLTTMVGVCASAQQVSTLYFLENAPMRHIVNPAFQPVSEGYVNFTPLGYTSLWLGNNSITLSDYVVKQDGKTVTALYPGYDRDKLIKQYRKTTLTDADMTLNLLSFGFRHKQRGYVHIGISERIECGVSSPKDFNTFLLNGGMRNLTGVNSYDLKTFGGQINMYTEIAGGYSWQLNDQWTIGGKIKLLLGQANLTVRNKELNLDASPWGWHLYGRGSIQIAGPINIKAIGNQLSYNAIQKLKGDSVFGGIPTINYLKPNGYGAAIDFGFTYKPHPQVQITASITDLGFIVWKGASFTSHNDSTFTGIPNLEYAGYIIDDKKEDVKKPDNPGEVPPPSGGDPQIDASSKISIDDKKLEDDIIDALETFAKSIRTDERKDLYARMISAKLNVGIDANFCNNKLGIGIVSKTRLFNGRLYEEVTLGGAVRPCNWFNLAISYSLVNNGKFSNFGAGISLMPYDGINMTLAMDYIPTSYAAYNGNYIVPYKTKGINLALGFSIVWGTNKPDKDKDGVWNQLDMCPGTPRGVKVDGLGCPIDSDGDGVPDYLDKCPDTPTAAFGLVDAEGCPLDSDNDGVPDYLDHCISSPEEIPFVDSLGCNKDSDYDGVPDYLDKCPDTDSAAIAFVDSLGCDKDSDHDGVPDYLDKCPDTDSAAIAFVDSLGCDKDSDNDSVPDYLDECPTVPGPAINKGCPVIQKAVRNLFKKAMQGIQFETGKAVIKKSSYGIMNDIAKVFLDNPTYMAEVQGHTDNTGSAELNKKLSQSRANSVRDYLIKAGVPAERLTAVGYGPDKPIADNKTKAGRAQNRRVEFDITFEQITYEDVLDHADTTNH